MTTTKAQFTTYFTEVKGFGMGEIKALVVDYRHDLEAYLRDCGADDTVIEEMNEYLK